MLINLYLRTSKVNNFLIKVCFLYSHLWALNFNADYGVWFGLKPLLAEKTLVCSNLDLLYQFYCT